MHIKLSPNDSRNKGDNLLYCTECDEACHWEEDGRGVVFCACQRCYECGSEPGTHTQTCEEGLYLATALDGNGG